MLNLQSHPVWARITIHRFRHASGGWSAPAHVACWWKVHFVGRAAIAALLASACATRKKSERIAGNR
jgi:hypothetical protein